MVGRRSESKLIADDLVAFSEVKKVPGSLLVEHDMVVRRTSQLVQNKFDDPCNFEVICQNFSCSI